MSRDSKLALALFFGSLIVLLVLSARSPLGPANSDYAALVNQAENVVRGVAREGFSFLTSAEGDRAIEDLSKRPLAPLLSAWSALSLGRVGLLDGSSSVRLPWLVLAALGPVGIFLRLRRLVSVRCAVLGGAWLLAAPGFIDSALTVNPASLSAWAGWLVLAAVASAAQARRAHERCAWVCASGGIAWFGFGLSFAMLWVVPLLIVHGWLERGHPTLRASEHGKLPVSAATLAVVLALPLAVLAFDPLLWRSQAPAMIRRLFEEQDAPRVLTASFGALVLPSVLALSGAVALAHAALARRFATGEFRPPRNQGALGLGLMLAVGASVALALFQGQLAEQLLRPLLACLVAIGAAAIARRWFSRHALVAESALLVLSLLVR